VAWREGQELVGWAPLAPTGKEHPATWTFVPREKLGEPVEKVAVSAIRVGPALQRTHRLVRVPVPAPSRAPVPAPAPREAGGAMASAGH
jgi:hypothetical protein